MLATALHHHEMTTQEQIERDFAISAKTSIFRASPSVPLRFFVKERAIAPGSCLHFGKGRGDTDSNELRKHVAQLSDYDYTYCQTDIVGQHFDCVIAIYVLNTLPPAARAVAWQQIHDATRDGFGQALIAVRSDKERIPKAAIAEQDGYRMGRTGTFQHFYSKQGFIDEAKQYFQHVEVCRYSAAGLYAICSIKKR